MSVHCRLGRWLQPRYIAGGNVVGGGQITGGMQAEQEFAFVVRPGIKVDEGTGAPIVPGGWL